MLWNCPSQYTQTNKIFVSFGFDILEKHTHTTLHIHYMHTCHRHKDKLLDIYIFLDTSHIQ